MLRELVKGLLFMDTIVYASSVSSSLLSTLPSGDLPLFCLSRHDHACNFQSADGLLIALVTAEQGNGPFHIVLPHRLPPLLTNKGDLQTHWRPGVLFIGPQQISLQQAAIWQPDLPALDKLSVNALLSLHEELNRQPPSPLHSSSTAFYARAQQGIAALQAGLTQGDNAKIQAGARYLAGLGPGLTPAGDDFLVGLLAAMVACRLPLREAPTTLCLLIAQTAAAQTTQLSARWLACAGQGHFGEAWHHLITALNSNASATITTAAHRILTTGATSGVDAMSGFLFGLRLLEDTTQRATSHETGKK
ncbi:MAG: DUF2877 domain-containing protein [Caldilinea sp. CFX5]|nr:DUF2877 domain-containing protein [Caldilinea sp. CFX5]